MNLFDDTEIEQRLRAMRPAKPTKQLTDRLAAALGSYQAATVEITPTDADRSHGADVRPGSRVIEWLPTRWVFPLAAAACFVVTGLAAFLHSQKVPAPPHETPAFSAQIFTPVETNSKLVAARDLGVFVADNDKPYRLIETTWVENETSRSDNGAELLTTQTRSELVPIPMKIY